MEVAWYVSAQNQTFGPYSHEQMKTFALERRLSPQSLVRMGDQGAFVAAQSHAALARCFESNGLQSGDAGGARKAAATPTESSAPAASVPIEGQVSNFLVLVQVRAGSQRDFEAAMKQMGPYFRLNAQVWVLQSERNANTIKMTLSPHVGSQDQLVVVDAARNRLAWHNVAVHDASRLREVWKMPHER